VSVIVSACLLGLSCRYDGTAPEISVGIRKLAETEHIIPVCPEQLGGLPTPRPRAERKGEKILTEYGEDVNSNFFRGAEEVLKLLELFPVDLAVLKERSPSCGKNFIYDGSFSGKIVEGQGVLSELLSARGINVISESEL